jgi:hypothetical protein
LGGASRVERLWQLVSRLLPMSRSIRQGFMGPIYLAPASIVGPPPRQSGMRLPVPVILKGKYAFAASVCWTGRTIEADTEQLRKGSCICPGYVYSDVIVGVFEIEVVGE